MHNGEGRVDRDYPTGHLSTVAKCCCNVECRFYHVNKRNIPHRRWMFFLEKTQKNCVSFHWKGWRFKSTLLLRRYNGYSRLHECTSYVVGYCWMLSILYYWFAWQVTGQVIHSFFLLPSILLFSSCVTPWGQREWAGASISYASVFPHMCVSSRPKLLMMCLQKKEGNPSIKGC
jgi:hypothetical protein